jgi:hypothetical protein
MPGPVSDSSKGPWEGGPYVPSYCYSKGPRICPCGHHEGYHADSGECLHMRKCRCAGLPADCLTPMEEM